MLTLTEKQRLMEKLPDFLLLSDAADAAALKGIGAVEAASMDEVRAAYEIIENRRGIFYAIRGQEKVEDILDKCRILAASTEDLESINRASEARGTTTMVGLLMPADGYQGPGITTGQLRGMVHGIKQLKNISVCGCIITGNVDGLHGKALGKFVRSTYQTAKAMTYILPCSMPYICISGLLEAMARNEQEHPEDLEEFLTEANIVGMQNSTAFYADYYVM